ncbi:hypothetical protein SY88_10685, partial [Clostridiales bacterium PH28_bin88]
NGLTITSTGLAITAPANGLTVTASDAGLVTARAITDVSATRANVTNTAGTPDTTYEVLKYGTWSFGIVNASLDTNAQANVKLQISPDGATWKDEAGPVTINQNAMDTLVASIFLKYARVYYNAVNASSAVTLKIYFQGHA